MGGVSGREPFGKQDSELKIKRSGKLPDKGNYISKQTEMKEAREWKCSKYAEYFLMKGLSLGLQPGIPRLSANRLLSCSLASSFIVSLLRPLLGAFLHMYRGAG